MHHTVLNMPKHSLSEAYKLYQEGANSNPYAVLDLAQGLSSRMTEGTPVVGVGQNGEETRGALWMDAEEGDDELLVAYEVTDSHETPTGCRVAAGILFAQDFEKCFVELGNVTIGEEQYAYSYDLLEGNFGGQSLMELALDTEQHRIDSEPQGEFYDDMWLFNDYYGTPEYADTLVTAAFEGDDAGLDRGNMNFEGMAESVRAGM